MTRPNIVIILADQLSSLAVGAGDGPSRRTPHLDRLARRGATFADAYTACPLCVPARAALWTGLYPNQTGIESNTRTRVVAGDVATLGMLFTSAGYRCLHYGKTHDAGSLRGFRTLDFWRMPVPDVGGWKSYHGAQLDRYTRTQAVRFLRTAPDSPFLLVADFVNPHDICDWVGDHAGPHADKPRRGRLPTLPANFHTDDLPLRPEPVRNNAPHNKRVAQTAGWTEENWRHYLAAYFHYVDMVDREIGRVLDAVERRPDARNTIVLCLSDHGEAMAAHRLVTKAATFYEETTRIPLIISGPGIPPGRTLRGPLVSVVDLLPTLCDLAGIEAPAPLPGLSLAPLLRGGRTLPGRDCVIATWGEPNSPAWARMVRTPRYKYTCYAAGGGEELYDLETDPGETRTLIRERAAAPILREHRRILRQFGRRCADPFPVPA